MVAVPKIQELASWHAESTDAAAIGAALVRVWREAARPQSRGDGDRAAPAGLLRTRVANLLVYAASAEEAERAETVLAEVIRRHPIRSLLCVVLPESKGSRLSASLRICCEPLAGRKVCFEQIRVTAEGSEVGQLSSVATQLLVHDLPTLLWCIGQPRLESPELAGLSELSDVLVIDSAEFDGQAGGLASLARVVEGWHGRKALADLNWDRLSNWRDVIAQFFDSRSSRPLLDQIRRIEMQIATPGGPDSAQALLLAGWLGSRLGWEYGAAKISPEGLRAELRRGDDAVEVHVSTSTSRAKADRSLRALQIDAGEEGSLSTFSLRASESMVDGTATVELCEGVATQRCFAFEQRDEAALLAEEIESLGHERALDDALSLAGRLAGGLKPNAKSQGDLV
jgi:glucose-6-phosphate dehydrogenase assembly protein OpcA